MSATVNRSLGTPSARALQLWSTTQTLALVVLPTLFLTVFIRVVLSTRELAFDFRHAYWSAGHRLLDGANPYAWTHEQIQGGFAFVYPALSAIIFAPLALMPRHFGSVLFTFVAIGMAPATLWVLRVRDWRVYSITMLWLPVYTAWQTTNETIFLVFGVACLWRYRDKAWIAALITVIEISLKPLMWPLAVWLLATRRWRASIYSLLLGVAINVAAWWIVGFGEIREYLHVAALDTTGAWRSGYGVAAFVAHFGLSRGVGDTVTLLLSVALIVAISCVGWVKRDDLQAMTLTVALTLAAAPLVWNHYFTLLLIPLALNRPRFNWLWAFPLLMWLSPPQDQGNVALWQAGTIAGIAVVTLAVLARDCLRHQLVVKRAVAWV
jgi:alpha-1,2-mannosyltransferase